MIELEVYAPGIRNPEKIMGLGIELDLISGLRYKVDTNHDIVYMEFSEKPPTLHDLQSIFRKLKLNAKFVGALPPELKSKSETQLFHA